MKKVIIVGVLALMVVLGCSRPGNNPVNSDKIWWGAPDNNADWIDVTSFCSYRIPATLTAADSICEARGYYKSSGYEQENCYVGGEKRVVLSKVACSIR